MRRMITTGIKNLTLILIAMMVILRVSVMRHAKERCVVIGYYSDLRPSHSSSSDWWIVFGREEGPWRWYCGTSWME